MLFMIDLSTPHYAKILRLTMFRRKGRPNYQVLRRNQGLVLTILTSTHPATAAQEPTLRPSQMGQKRLWGPALRQCPGLRADAAAIIRTGS
jgi:hypothetical protein